MTRLPTLPPRATRPADRRSGARAGRPPVHTGGGLLREAMSAQDLRALREAQLNRALQHLDASGTTVRVGCYALVGPGGDPGVRLRETRALANRLGWAPGPRLVTYDSTGMTDPLIRPQLARLLAAIGREDIHGIVTVSRTDITDFPTAYLDVLAAVQARGGFLALARDETGL
ncbi:hypothetical protein GTY54_48050 [Streptomyces sp. SID625]|nr:hypothetical protein [Streptomyces sp. SID625]